MALRADRFKGAASCRVQAIGAAKLGATWRLREPTSPAVLAAHAPKSYSFTEDDYLAQSQSAERAQWAEGVRRATGSRDQQFWDPVLDPAPLLDHVVLVLVSPRRPVSVGTVARSASCFEVSTIRVVQPRCGHITRQSKSASKGAQYLLYKTKDFDSIAEAAADCQLRVAFSRWVAGRGNAFYDVSTLLSHPVIQDVIREPISGLPGSSEQGISSTDGLPAQSVAAPEEPAGSQQPSRPRVALIFGREELGLSDAEVDACDVVCSIPIGRLQESLSLSHAVSIVLSGLYAQRLSFITNTAGKGGAGYAVASVEGLAEGYDASAGTER